jgi:hypothetical protein
MTMNMAANHCFVFSDSVLYTRLYKDLFHYEIKRRQDELDR